MKCVGNFVFKGIERKDGGEFTNEKGKLVKYDESFVVRLDEVEGDVISERKLKFPIDNTVLYNRLKSLKPYDHITLDLEVVLYNNQAKVIPVGIIDSNNK